MPTAKFIDATRVDDRGRVLIPRELRQGERALKPGEKLLVYVHGDEIVLRRLK
jgi:AbrB family looped-hinge helix DNA binding protein